MRPAVKQRHSSQKSDLVVERWSEFGYCWKKKVLQSVEVGRQQRTIPADQTKCETHSLHTKEDCWSEEVLRPKTWDEWRLQNFKTIEKWHPRLGGWQMCQRWLRQPLYWQQGPESCLETTLRASSEWRVLLEFWGPDCWPCCWSSHTLTTEMVTKAIIKMKNGKAAEPSGIVAEMLKASGDPGKRLIDDLANDTIRNDTIPSDWKNSFIVNIYKGKGDVW